ILCTISCHGICLYCNFSTAGNSKFYGNTLLPKSTFQYSSPFFGLEPCEYDQSYVATKRLNPTRCFLFSIAFLNSLASSKNLMSYESSLGGVTNEFSLKWARLSIHSRVSALASIRHCSSKFTVNVF